MALIFDTGPLVACLNKRDPDHASCRRLLEQADEMFVIPAPVIPEVDYWLRIRMATGAFPAFLDEITEGNFVVEDLVIADYQRARELCDKYADSDIGFVDAAVMAVVERLNEPKVATLDHRHFRMLRPRHVDSLILLPE